MPPIFVGSTELTTVGDIKIGGVDVQQVFVGATQIFPTSGPDPSITFTWDPENDQALPGGTFTRASIKLEYDGTDFTELSSGTIPENSAAVVSGAQGFHPEPAATNTLLFSTDFSQSFWTKDNVNIAADGLNALNLNQTTITANTADAQHRVFASGILGGSAFTIIKEGTLRYANLRYGDDGSTDYSTFDLQLGAVSEDGAGSIGRATDLGNAFYKSEVTTQFTTSFCVFGQSDTGTPGTADYSFNGAGTETTLICHIQVENTSYVTSPIVTAGSVQSRIADVLDTGVPLTTAFSALLDLTLPTVVGAGQTITLLGPDATAVDILRVDAANDLIMDDGGTPVTIGAVTPGTRIKVSYGRDAAGRSASLDGATAVTGGAPDAGHVGETIELGSRVGVNQSRCIHHLTTLFDEKKSDAELESLSS